METISVAPNNRNSFISEITETKGCDDDMLRSPWRATISKRDLCEYPKTLNQALSHSPMSLNPFNVEFFLDFEPATSLLGNPYLLRPFSSFEFPVASADGL